MKIYSKSAKIDLKIYRKSAQNTLKFYRKSAIFGITLAKISSIPIGTIDYENLSAIPIEIKSGKNYYVHNAITNLIKIKNYNIKEGYLFTNDIELKEKNGILKMPIYFISFIE